MEMWQFCRVVGDHHFCYSGIFLPFIQVGLNFINFLFRLFEHACSSVSGPPFLLLWYCWQIQLFCWLRFMWVTHQRELGFWLYESKSHPDCTEIHMYCMYDVHPLLEQLSDLFVHSKVELLLHFPLGFTVINCIHVHKYSGTRGTHCLVSLVVVVNELLKITRWI